LTPARRALALAGVCGLAGLLPAARAATPGEVLVGQVLRDATMQGLNGPPRQLSSYRGRPLIINVWASWCAPCRVEMPALERLAWGDLGARFTLIGISTDDHIAAALLLLKRTNATISHYIDRRLELEHMLGATQLPLTVAVDAQGRVLEKVVGVREWDGAEGRRLVERWFPAPAPRPASARRPAPA